MSEISDDEAGKNVCAFLDMLAFSEGTDHPRQKTNDRGYDVIVGGELFSSYKDHPRKLVTLNKLGIKSTAAGRYQLLSRYWNHYRDLLKLSDFGPYSQDCVAIRRQSASAGTFGRHCPALVTVSTSTSLKRCLMRTSGPAASSQSEGTEPAPVPRSAVRH